MQIRVRDLLNIADEKVYEVDINNIKIDNYPYLRSIKEVKGYITFYYDVMDKLYIEYSLSGIMVCPDSYTLKDVDVDFDIESDEPVVFKENEDGFFIYGDMDLVELVKIIVLPEAPIKVEKNNKTMYHYGDDWSFMSEEEYDKTKKNKIDPRLEILKDYKEEK